MKNNTFQFGQHIALVSSQLSLSGSIVTHDDDSILIKVPFISLKKKEKLLSSINFLHYKKIGIVEVFEQSDGIVDDVYFKFIC
ncbi:hypothetical protein [Carboxylicivirga sp. RSCT41]|uniref:hypothetical protein n=1 Tax=Carboxylicivirga agarovorans TaxID=3417570 RepID=UPI003D32AF4A